MDKQTRNRLQKLVSTCRKLLVEEFTKQLQEFYGIQPTGIIAELSTLTHLDNEQYRIAVLLRERVNHLASTLSSEENAAREEVQRLIREQAFTVLNRFAALKMCEEREITKECVKDGYQSKGFQLFLATAGSGIGDTYDRYVVFIKSIFDELALDLGVLFDRFSPFSLLFPRENALDSLFTELNTPDLADIWKEDETIGWIYQYFNSKEERQAMRKSSSAPRNSRELAVRNQFFTPRYVVQFLTDNTLGRIWYEMTRGNTELKEQCEYLVRRPNEVFLEQGQNPPETLEEETDKSQEELLKEPEYIPYRKIKDPREIRMLDPACGSMHFGLYAFDLYETIYEEVWERYPELLQDIRERVKERHEFLSLVPELIIRHNIHGIDIDHRAVQIAGLSLWLRAQKSYQRLGIKPENRPWITRSNVVCAEPMPGEKEYLEEFVCGLKPAVLGDLVRDVWEKMQLAGEAGSLLKIEEELSGSILKAREAWEKYKFEKGAYAEQDLFEKSKQLSLKEMIRFDIGDIESLKEWDQMEEMVLSALKEFAESASGNGGYDRKLFAEDAARGFAFIDVCRKRYDVVLMNPPFGESVVKVIDYISNNYSSWCSNLASAFVGRPISKLSERGKVGSVTDRSILIKSSYKDFRVNYALGDFEMGPLADLGWNVLDANVEVAAVVYSLEKENLETEELFIDVRSIESKDSFIKDTVNSEKILPQKKWLKSGSFKHLPNASISHDMPDFIIKWFNIFPALKESGAKALQGHAIKMDWYGRMRWEVDPLFIGANSIWSNMYNGGFFSRFYLPLQDVVLWKHNGMFLRTHPSTRWSNAECQQKPGIGYGKRGDILDAHIVPEGHVFTVEGLFILPNEIDNAWYYLGLLNSPLCSVILNYFCGQHKHAGYLDLLPTPRPNSSNDEKKYIASLSKQAWQLKRDIDTTNEASPFFRTFWFFTFPEVKKGFEAMIDQINLSESSISDILGDIERAVEETYGLKDPERLVIEGKIRKASNAKSNGKDKSYSSEDYTTDRSSKDFISYNVGISFSRWDIRIALDPRLAPALPDPFDPLPVCPPGMLVDPDGLPAKSGTIVSEEWMRARPNAITLPPEGSVKNPTISDSEYPIEIAWNGILVDDPYHKKDIVNRMRNAFRVIWQEKADSIEQEACEILGIKDLRDYFRRPSGFFADHLKRYSKSRRQAPIYWPLSTTSGSYTLWIYYPRLTDQALYRCVNEYINPKLEDNARDIEFKQKETEKNRAMKVRQELEDLLNLQQELKEFNSEILRVAELPYKPDLNDGVLITASPLHKLFRLPKWSKDLKKCWDNLEKGDYDWAHLAYSIWPDRVREKCRKDRSLAIAHDLEDICEVEPKAVKKKIKKD